MSIDKHPQASASEAQQRLSVAVELLRGWVWETDPEHRFTFFSDSVARFAGRPPEWHYGRTRQELGNLNRDEPSPRAFERQLEAREPFGPLEVKRSQDGRTIWMRTLGAPQFDASGRFMGYRGIAYEVTGEVEERVCRQEAEAARQESLATLSTMISCFPIAISVFDRSQRLAFANDGYFEILDLPRQKFSIGASVDEIIQYLAARGEFRGGDTAALIDKHIAVIGAGGVHRYQRTRPNGRTIEVLGAPISGGGLVRTYDDITERLEKQWRHEKALIELRAAQDQLAEAHREIGVLRAKLAAAAAASQRE